MGKNLTTMCYVHKDMLRKRKRVIKDLLHMQAKYDDDFSKGVTSALHNELQFLNAILGEI